MRYLLIILMVIMLTVSAAAGQVISKVGFSGDKPRGLIGLIDRPGRPFQPDSLAADSARIVSFYQESGWYDCQVSYESKSRRDGIEINYNIKRGEQYELSIVPDSTSLPDSLLDDIKAIINLYNGRPAVESRLGNLADDIIGFYANLGYPYCAVRFNDLQVEKPSTLKLTAEIQAGPAVTISKVQFPGRKNIDKEFLQMYAGLTPPVGYSWQSLMLAQKRLSRASFLSQVDNFRLRYFQNPENGIVDFPVTEVSPLIIDGAAGYSSSNKDFYGRFTATLSNILGKGRQVNLDWVKKDKYSHRLQISLNEPYPLGMPANLSLALYQDDRDSLFIENGIRLGFNYLSSETYTYGLSLGGSVLNPETYGRAILPGKNKLKLSVSFAADTRDYPLNPRTGDYLRLAADFITESAKADSLFPASTSNYRTAEIRIEKYLPLFGRAALYGALTARGDFSEDIPVDRLFPLGGFGSLRGYSQDMFYVSRLAVATAEYRWLTSRRGRAYIFSDMALFRLPESSGNSSTEFRAGFGIGLAAATKLGIASIELAVPHDEGLSAAKLHFGIITGL